MKDLQRINLPSNTYGNFLLKVVRGFSEKERYEYKFPLSENAYGQCSATNFNNVRWEHIMLNLEPHKRCASYEEMSALKEKFWRKNEVAIQVHPKKANYINIKQYALHLWRNKDIVPQAEARLKRRISSIYEEGRKYFSGERKEVFLSEQRVLVIFCGEDWLSWEDVCQIKQKYWNSEEAAVQFNVSTGVDLNPEHMILLWDATNFQLPPKELV